jgi:hypothetical protein
MLAGVISTVGVVGAGGSGKSRMCEEFSLDKRRRGCSVVVAKQTKTHEAPHRVLADLLASLSTDGPVAGDPAGDVVRAVAQYDRSLAVRSASAIRALFGTNHVDSERVDSKRVDSEKIDEESIVSALVLLIAASNRSAPLIIHLQDLHWCNADVLLLLERTLLQLSRVGRDGTLQVAGPRVLFIFEGRVRESGSEDDPWSSAPFEAFLERAVDTTVMCRPFSDEDALTFCRRLFEDRHNTGRLVVDELLALQAELIEDVYKTAGANPFHALEQVRLLKESGVLGQNPRTGLMYMIRPKPVSSLLPESVFAAIRLRWQYLRNREPALALLVWASALLEDQVPAPLFRHLWRALAPDVALRDVDATDILWTGDGQARDVVFRHENYFESLRRFTVSEPDRRRIVETYCAWFSSLRRPSPADRFRWARAMLQLPDPDIGEAENLLVSALDEASERGDVPLARRIMAFHLDLVWDVDESSPLPMMTFLRHCDDEISLSRELLSIDRDQTARRLGRVRAHLDARLGATRRPSSSGAATGLQRRDLTMELLHAQVLFNDRRPAEAAVVAGWVVDRVRAFTETSLDEDAWESLEMEALYTLSCAQALSGDFGSAVQSSAAASKIATGSSFALARKIVSTYGTMLLSEDPHAGEVVLRKCVATWPQDDTSDAFLVHVHLSMALVYQAYRSSDSERSRTLLAEARELTTRVFDSCRRLGLYPDAGAAALVRGVVSALTGERDEISWFAQGVAAAARGRQMETLWRSHINLAAAMYQKEKRATSAVQDHALAALAIMEDTLSAYSQPDRSPRFRLLRVGMAAAASMLLAAGDDRGRSLLEHYPRLRSHFLDPETGLLAPYQGEDRHYQWLRVGEVDYVLY